MHLSAHHCNSSCKLNCVLILFSVGMGGVYTFIPTLTEAPINRRFSYNEGMVGYGRVECREGKRGGGGRGVKA